MAQILSPGTQAPDFTLNVTPDQKLSLHELQGKPVILAFYPADWSPVCGDQMALYNEILPEFQKYEAELLGISVDGAWCHAAFSRDRNLHFPLLADFEPKGAVAKKYMGLTGKKTDLPNGHCSCSILRGRSFGVTARRAQSILEPMAFSRRWKISL